MKSGDVQSGARVEGEQALDQEILAELYRELRAALAGRRFENMRTRSAFAVRRFTRRYGALAAAAGIGVGAMTWLVVHGASLQPVLKKELASAEGHVVPAAWMQPADARDAAMGGESPDLVGVVALPLTGAPGPLLALGDTKSLIDGPDGAGSVLVQANVGKGVVFAFAHGGYLSGENIRKDANLRECMRRVVKWAHEREGAGAIVMSGAGKAVVEAIGGECSGARCSAIGAMRCRSRAL